MNRPSALFFFFFIFVNAVISNAQAPAIEWQQCYGGPGGDYAYAITPTNDGGFISAGKTESGGGDVEGYHGNPQIGDIWVIKTDKDGDVEWKKCLGDIYFDAFNGKSIRQTADGGYILSASSTEINCDGTVDDYSLNFWLVKLDSRGNIEWHKYFGGSKHEYEYGIALTTDGGYILTGHSESADGDLTGNHGGRDAWVIKVNSQGILEWQRNMGGSGDDGFYAVDATADGGCILTGFTNSTDGDLKNNKGYYDYWIVKLNSSGVLVWNKTYGGSMEDISQDIKATPDGGCVVAGTTASPDGDVSGIHNFLGPYLDAWLVKLNSQGEIEWQDCYGGQNHESVFAVDLTIDGGYVLAGLSESSDGDVPCNIYIDDGWVIKVNNKGDVQWTKSFGGSYYDQFFDIHQLKDGSYIIAGTTCSTEMNGYHPATIGGSCGDFWVLKLSAPLIQIPPPSVTINKSAALICSGRATLTAQVKYAGTNYKLQWYKNGVDVGVNTSTYSATDFKETDEIVCELTTIGGNCDDLAMASISDKIILYNNSITVHPQVSISADNTTVCDCTPLTFKVFSSYKGPGSAYAWVVNGIPNGMTDSIFTHKNLKDGDVITCIYNNNSVCVPEAPVQSNTIQITAATNVTASVTITALSTEICTATEAAFYAVATNAGSNPFYQWQVNNVTIPGNNDTLYINTLEDGDIVRCVVRPDPLYTCATNDNATSNNITVQVHMPVTPSLSITASDTVACKGSNIIFTANAVNTGLNPSYQWYINDRNTGTDAPVFSSANFYDKDRISCLLIVDDVNTCFVKTQVTSNIITLSIKEGVASSVAITSNASKVCIGKPLTFTATASNAGKQPFFQWKLNNVAVGGNDSVYSNSNLKNGDAISCLLTPGNEACLSSPVMSNIVYAVIADSPVLTIHPADTLIAIGKIVQLKAHIFGRVNSFTWSPPSGLQDPYSLEPFTLPIKTPTSFLLHVVNDQGCQASAMANIRIFRKLNMPGAFTPNGDGRNDIYRIPPEVNMTLIHFSIFDRWGKKIFSTHNITEGWNGVVNGSSAGPGTYVYVLSGSDSHGAISLKGSFVLIR